MTALGLVEDVKRTLFRDEAFNVSEYPLDEKIGLLNINGKRSRYTQVFAWNTARLYAQLTEKDTSTAIKEMLGIEIDEKQIAIVGQTVAQYYMRANDTAVNGESNKTQIETETANDIECTNTTAADVVCRKASPEGFLVDKLKELEASPDRDLIIRNAADGKVDGAEGAQTEQTVLYVLADGTGVPGMRRELSDNGKNGGKAGTFEAKIGCVYRQGYTVEGIPVLDKGNIARLTASTKYIGTTDKVGGFNPMFAEFVHDNSMLSDKQVVFLSDGAAWLGNTQMLVCPTAIAIVDFYHAAEHLNDIMGTLRFHSPKRREEFSAQCQSELKLGNIENLTVLIRAKANSSNKEKIVKQLAYFERNADKMRYGLFSAAGLFIGSGVMEAGCKTIVCKRLKHAGMHWSKKNAKGVIALRCAICSNEFKVPGATLIAA